jgi:hypothetical protein
MSRTRDERIRDFILFFTTAEVIFTAFRDHDPKAEKFQRLYQLNVCPGSRMGGTNNRVVEIFWGNRPYETIAYGGTWRALTEYGATLLFERDNSGYVIISVYPAGTETKRPVESSIALKVWIDPICLRDRWFLEQLWKDFMAYMEMTSLEGKPSWVQKRRISVLRKTKHLVIDTKWMPTRFSVSLNKFWKGVATVFFSGAFFVFIMNKVYQPSLETETQLQLINKNLEIVNSQLNHISENNSNLKDISINVDSIKFKIHK